MRRTLQSKLDNCKDALYIYGMIKTFRHKGLAKLWNSGKASDLPQHLRKRVQERLNAISAAKSLNDLRTPSHRLHEWKGHPGLWSIDVSGPWRILFRFHDGDAYDVDLQQPH
jgi:proteic killer suppression protein